MDATELYRFLVEVAQIYKTTPLQQEPIQCAMYCLGIVHCRAYGLVDPGPLIKLLNSDFFRYRKSESLVQPAFWFK
jgi:hypothetical protein